MQTQIDSRVVGNSIRHLRQSRNWTQDYLAETLGYSVRTLRRIESGGCVNIDVINAFAKIFDVSAIDILSGDVLFVYSPQKWLLFRFKQRKKRIGGLRHTTFTLICFSRTFALG